MQKPTLEQKMIDWKMAFYSTDNLKNENLKGLISNLREKMSLQEFV